MRMTVLLVVVRLALGLVPYRRLQEVAATAPASEAEPEDLGDLRKHAWAAGVVGRRLLGARPCLTQALALQWVLGRRGYRTTLHIGVRKGPERDLEAHAWVTHRGRTIVGGWRSPHVYTLLRSVAPQENVAGAAQEAPPARSARV